MAVDEQLAGNFRQALAARLGADLPGVTEKNMMGGTCFMLNGNMVGAADRTRDGVQRYMFRVGKDNEEAADLPGGEPMVMGDRLMRGFYFVNAERCDEVLLRRWLDISCEFAASLPPK